MPNLSFTKENILRIRAGKKTQTRRVIPVSDPDTLKVEDGWIWSYSQMEWVKWLPVTYSLYGQPGEIGWIQEGLRRQNEKPYLTTYDADGTFVETYREDTGELPILPEWKWQREYLPAMFCPRWASRMDYEVVDVRAERLQSITESDAIAEGVLQISDAPHWVYKNYSGNGQLLSPIMSYESLWNSINGKKPGYTWADNPWVRVIDFRPILKNNGSL